MDIYASGKQISIRDEELNKTLVDYYNDTDTDTDRKEEFLFSTLHVVYHSHLPHHKTIHESTDGSPVFVVQQFLCMHAHVQASTIHILLMSSL